jgi:hypothetical protein
MVSIEENVEQERRQRVFVFLTILSLVPLIERYLRRRSR